MSSLIEHAKREFKLLGYIPLNQEQEDGPNKWIQESVIELLNVFSAQGHSGFSAIYCINLFNKLAKFENISPLTGNDDEWNEVDESNHIYQNNRCSEVFKEGKDGNSYWIKGKIFSDDNGETWFTNSESRVDIEFPW